MSEPPADRGIETTVVKLGVMTVRIPADWRPEPADDDWWRCGDDGGEYTVFLRAELAPPHESTPADATPTEHALAYAKDLEESLPSHGYDIVEASPSQSGRIVRAVRVFEDDGSAFSEVRWFAYTGFNGRVGIFRARLITGAPVRDEAEMHSIIALFEEQVRADSWSGTRITVDGAPLMRDFDMDGLLTLRLPARFRNRREDDMWFLFDPGGAPGSIWADYDILEADRHGGRSPFELAEFYAREWPADEEARLVSRRLAAAPLGAVLTVMEEDIDEGDDDDPPLRHVTWLYFADGSERKLMATFRLMFPRRLADDSAVASLQALLDREIRALRVGEGSSV